MMQQKGNTESVDISIVVPCYNEIENIREFVHRVTAVIRETKYSHEIVIVDDGSGDGTYDLAKALMTEFGALRVFRLSRNFGHQAAVTAGLTEAHGRAVILMDADLQDPPQVIHEMIGKWEQGFEVVYGQRKTRLGETSFKIWTAKLFYRVLRLMVSYDIPVDTGDFRLMDRKVVDALLRLPERHRFIRGMVSWIGFKQTPVLYDRNERFAGETKYPFQKMVLFALDALLSFSMMPLRFMALCGGLIILFSFLLTVLIVVAKVFNAVAFIPGYPSITLLILFFGGVQLFSIGLVGEFVGRIYQEVKGRPLYIIAESSASPEANLSCGTSSAATTAVRNESVIRKS